MRIALLDGDVLVYNSGFASDSAAKRAYKLAHGNLEGFDINIHHEPFNFCKHGIEMQIQSISDTVDADELEVIISHPVNFREQFYPPYKQNRDLLHKPFWYTELKEWLLEEGALFSEKGDEADDMLGSMQMKYQLDGHHTPIICTIDKDLDMIPGLHYNWSPTRKANGVYEMSDPECLRCFYRQMIQGDRTDNIPGIFQHTGMKAEQAWFDPLEGFDTHAQMYNYILNQVYQGDKEFVDLIGKLLWIKRDDKWYEPPELV